jgi:hypothetical protein
VKRQLIPLALVAAGCESAAQGAYREQIECLSQYPEGALAPPPGGEGMPGRTPERIIAERETFRTRAIEHGQALGKTPADVAADAHAFHVRIVGPDAHASEERMEALGETCRQRLEG